ncbi:TonB-dependent receptor [Thermodesulforhabdus norvegica]|uniref:Iron complex outermembrane recepter protein n=1 Tax=Thermodesulforhabdus norvegica TaxID=39841 RepID=A0A1I4UYN5_9BACT|nr:TonB-dependent receptor [Thermodesulforhabdus norvegica]SFM93883.1 iron complex outermembrane recepter protein [Thermodesulforhabdus norvegica]
MRRILLLALMAFLMSTTLGLAGDEEQEASLEALVVTGSPIIEGNVLDKYGGQKTVVTENQVFELNAQDLPSALRRVPGVTISRYNVVGSFGGATGGAVFVRGMGSSRPGAEIKTFFDGVPVYMSIWNHPLMDLLPVDPAKSIEVYKSPQPHAFGNAFAAINLVPKEQPEEGFSGSLETAYGSYDTVVAKGAQGGRKGYFDYYVAGAFRSSDGHRDNANGEMKNLYGHVGWNVVPGWRIYFRTLWNDNYADDPGVEGDPSSRLGRYETSLFLNELTLENHLENASGFLKIYRSEGDGNWLDQPTDEQGIKEDLYNEFLFYGLKMREEFAFSDRLHLVTGFDWERAEGHYDKEFSDGSKDRWEGAALYLASPYAAISYDLTPVEDLHIVPSFGVRYYSHSDFPSEWAPHAGLQLTYRDTRLHVGYARGVNYPGLDTIVFSEKVIPALSDSWKELSAEVVDHFEAGIHQLVGDFLIAELTLFYDDGSNRYVVVPPPPFPPAYDNVEDFRTRGIEASLTFSLHKNLALFLGITAMDAHPSDLPYVPDYTVSTGLNWKITDHLSLYLDAEYVGDMYVREQARRRGAENTVKVDDYFVLNGKVSYKLPFEFLPSETVVYLALENITDTDYEYLPGYPMPGTSVMGGIKCAF